MNSKELRIGNLVEYNGEVETVTGVTEENPFVNTITPDYLDYEEITPIPLTGEWLLKFGFEEWTWCSDCAFIPLFFGDSLFCRYYNNQWHVKRLKVGRDREGFFGKTEGRYVLPKGKIKYVHQLQNLYFALTNKELKNKHDN